LNNVLVLGAGMVAMPFVQYLLSQPDCKVKVASLSVGDAVRIIGNHQRGEAQVLDVTDTRALRTLISDAQTDLVANFVPPTYHTNVAKLCIEAGKPMVTTSYVSDSMRALDKEAREAGVLILGEIGLDPGIDHMSAMKVIHKIQGEGGKVVSFYSVCGAIPAPEASLNPFEYKFSWFPSGALGAAKRPAKYLQDGQEIDIPSDRLLEHYSLRYIEGLGYLENYPNMNCLPYVDTYGIPTTRTIYRGTLRYMGWCETLKRFIELGLLDEKERSDLGGFSYRQLLEELTGSSDSDELERNLASKFHIDKDSTVMKRLEWLGFLSDEPLPLQQGSVFDILLAQMLKKMSYGDTERDMVVLQDEFIVEYPGGRPSERITSTLIDYGVPGGDSAIARTVGIPAAIATNLILQKEIDLKGIHIPVDPAIYEPVLRELQRQGISVSEKRELLNS